MSDAVVAFDVETTGLRGDDRVVSLGAWRIANGGDDVKLLHLIFDPGCASHPRAAAVHGYSDWTLRHQPKFADHASEIDDFFAGARVAIAHNASFDVGFMSREFAAVGREFPVRDIRCTMTDYRRSGAPGRASLAAICESIGIRREGQRHGALEDAWLAFAVASWLDGASVVGVPQGLGGARPFNFIEPPPPPQGSLPRPPRSAARVARETSQTILRAARPAAIMLLSICEQGGVLPSEANDVLVSLAHDTAARLGLSANAEAIQEVVADLVDLEVSQNLMTRAAKAIWMDEAARTAFPRWLASMAAADGALTTREREGIDRVKAAFLRAKPAD